MPDKFTEQDTETFYDEEDAVYRSFWDREGSLHWGLFDEATGRDFLKACGNLNQMMAEKALMGRQSKVLDFGCGNGTTATWLCKTQGCRVIGVDLSGVRIGNAVESLQEQPGEIQARLEFEKASATELPFPECTFSHIWSQATIYHVHEKETALREAFRVLEPGGTLVFDDLTKPRPDISENSRTYVYDRLLFDTEFSFESYQAALRRLGFQVVEAIDLSQHLKTSYQCLEEMARAQAEQHGGRFQALAHAYQHMVQAVERGDLGWGFYLCRK